MTKKKQFFDLTKWFNLKINQMVKHFANKTPEKRIAFRGFKYY